MNLYSTRGVHGQVVDLIGRRIALGELRPGETLDLEAIMVEADVSRTVVREVLRVLTAKGLVDARTRRGTFVTERATWNLLDADVMRWRTTHAPDPALVLELGEVREIFEPAAARRAAVRRTADQLGSLETAMRRLEAAHEGRADDHVPADIAFHRAVLDAAGNELLVRFEVVLEPALRARNQLAFHHTVGDTYLVEHRAVVDAIRERDGDRAEIEMLRLMRAAQADIRRILDLS